MKSAKYQHYILPIITIVLCLAVIIGMVYSAITINKTVVTPPIAGDQPSPSQMAGLNMPSDHPVKIYNDLNAQLPIGKVSNYSNPSLIEPFEIKTKSDLQVWLLSPDNGGRNAILTTDVAFDWQFDASESSSVNNNGTALILLNGTVYTPDGRYRHSSASDSPHNSNIASGRTLDGYGYNITYGAEHGINTIAQDSAFFVRDMRGTIKNVTFDVPAGKRYVVNNSANIEFHIGFLSIFAHSGAMFDNVKVNMAGHFGAQLGGDSSVLTGVFASQSGATYNRCEVSVLPGGRLQGSAGNYGILGGFAGRGQHDGNNSKVIDSVFDFHKNGASSFTITGGNPRGAAIFGEPFASSVDGFLVKNMDVSVNELAIFHANKGDSTNHRLYLFNNTYNNLKPTRDGNNLAFVRMIDQNDYDLNWDRIPSTDKNEKTRLVLSNIAKPDENKVVWGITQTTPGNSDLSKKHTYSDLYKYLLSSTTAMSIPSFSPDLLSTGGSIMNAAKGEIGVVDTLKFSKDVTSTPSGNTISNTASYTGLPYTLTATFKSVKGVVWNNASSYKVLYNDKEVAPVLPGSHIPKLRSRSSDVEVDKIFAYLDIENHRIVLVDDDITFKKASLTIKRGEAGFTARDVVTGDTYVDDSWSTQAIVVTLNVSGMTTASQSANRPNRVRVTISDRNDQSMSTAQNPVTWTRTATVGENTTSFRYNLEDTYTDMPYRFALFRDDVQLTEITSVGIKSKVDRVVPLMQLDSDSHLIAKPSRDLTQWMDRYEIGGNTDDALETAQIWIKTTSGASDINMEARAQRMLSPGVYGEFSEWGSLTKRFDDDRSVFIQRMYDGKLSREENQAIYGGEWIFQFRAVNGAKVTASPSQAGADSVKKLIQVSVKVDYTEYKVVGDGVKRVWHGSDMKGSTIVDLPAESCLYTALYPDGRNFFFRSEDMKIELTSAQDKTKNYSIANVNGTTVPSDKKFNYIASYKMPIERGVGATPEYIIALREYISGSIQTLANQEYGNLIPDVKALITIPNAIYGSSTLVYDYTTIVTNANNVVQDIASNRIIVGEYKVNVNAFITSGNDQDRAMYNTIFDISVTGTTLTITPKMIIVSFDPRTLASSLRNFDSQWIKAIIAGDQIVMGDTVTTRSIYPTTPPTEAELVDGMMTADCYVTLSNPNYATTNTCVVTLAMFMTDSADKSIFLIESKSDFSAIKGNLTSSKFRLIKDIDFAGVSIVGLTSFSGAFDGNGYSIKNANIVVNSDNKSQYNVGLFGELLDGAIIKNLTIEGIVLDYVNKGSATANVGVIAGKATGATITNVMIQGNLTAAGIHKDTKLGGVAGVINNTTISDVMTFLTILGVRSVTDNTAGNIIGGGIGGSITGSTLTNIRAFNQGNINAELRTNVGYISPILTDNTTDNVIYLANTILVLGTPLAGNVFTAKTYQEFLLEDIRLGHVNDINEVSGSRGGVKFTDIMNMLIPLAMRSNGFSLSNIRISSFGELLRMVAYSFASYEIISDIYCFVGYKYNGIRVYNNVVNNGGFQVISDDGKFVIGKM